VIFAQKVDKHYKSEFFGAFKGKFIKELKHLDTETFYKVLWAMVKAGEVKFQ